MWIGVSASDVLCFASVRRQSVYRLVIHEKNYTEHYDGQRVRHYQSEQVRNKKLKRHISVPGWEPSFFMGRLCDKIRPARLKGSREANAEFPKTAATFFARVTALGRNNCGRHGQNLNHHFQHSCRCVVVKEDNPIVFVVDDDPSVREALDSLIRSIKLNVLTFSTAEEFLHFKRPDAPGMPCPGCQASWAQWT